MTGTSPQASWIIMTMKLKKWIKRIVIALFSVCLLLWNSLSIESYITAEPCRNLH